MKRLAIQARQALPTPAARTAARTAAAGVLGTRRYLRLKAALARAAGRSVDSPEYARGVWFRHIGEAAARGLPHAPETVCEIGPGETIGAGLAALLSGAERYLAIDGAWAWDTARNLAMFDALAELFRRPGAAPADDRAGPRLEPGRLRRIRESIVRVNRDGSLVRYVVQRRGDPMREFDGTVDMVFSQAVMEHVDEPSLAYERMSRWLAPGGVMSHAIDFRSHLSARDWNGHWVYSDPVWKAIFLGGEPLINRVPCSEHVRSIRSRGFDLAVEKRLRDRSGIARSMLAPRFRDMSAEDLETRGLFVQAVKPGRSGAGGPARR